MGTQNEDNVRDRECMKPACPNTIRSNVDELCSECRALLPPLPSLEGANLGCLGQPENH